MELRWLASLSASCFYAADAVRRELPLVDARLAEALSGPVAQFVGELTECGLSDEPIWMHLLPLSAGIDNNRELAEVALTKTLGRRWTQANRDALAGRIADLEAAFRGQLPQLVEDLALRGGPIREQWEGRGPGLLHEVARLTEAELLVPEADVVLVYPALGGGGLAGVLYNKVLFEAVLANPVMALPEVVRLGWLLAQLNLDLPQYQGELNRQRAAELGALAMAPIALSAGQEVELCRCDEATLRVAMTAWRLSAAGGAPASAAAGGNDTAAVLMNWWDTYAASRPMKWPVALAALERMLGGAG